MALVRISSVIFHQGPVISGLSCFQYVNMLLHRGREWPQCIKMSNGGLQCVLVVVLPPIYGLSLRLWNLAPVLSVSLVLSSRTLPCCNYISACRKARPSLTASTRRHNYHSERVIWKNMETTIWKFLHPYSFCSRRKQLLIFKLHVWWLCFCKRLNIHVFIFLLLFVLHSLKEGGWWRHLQVSLTFVWSHRYRSQNQLCW